MAIIIFSENNIGKHSLTEDGKWDINNIYNYQIVNINDIFGILMSTHNERATTEISSNATGGRAAIFEGRSIISAAFCAELVFLHQREDKDLNMYEQAEALHDAELYAFGSIYKTYDKIPERLKIISEEEFDKYVAEYKKTSPRPNPFKEFGVPLRDFNNLVD